MSRDIQAVVYTDDQGNEYITGIAADVFSQVGGDAAPKVGGRDAVAADASLPPMPRNLSPRTATLTAPGQSPRRVVCLTKTASLFEATETTLTLPVFNDVDGALFTWHSSRGETKRRRDVNG